MAKLVHREDESLVQVGHTLQALVYTAHISSTFPTKLQQVWKPPLGLLKVSPGCFPDQCSPSYTANSLGFYGISGMLPEDVRSRSVEALGKKMSEIESKVKRSMVPHLLDAPSRSNGQSKARTLLLGLTLDIGTQVEDKGRTLGRYRPGHPSPPGGHSRPAPVHD